MTAPAATTVRLGERTYDITHRALVMGILNRTTDSFYDKGAYFAPERFVDRAAELVAEGADVLDVGGVKAGPGPEVGLEEELERVVPAVETLRSRFDLPVSVDTWRAEVARQAFAAGAVVGNDISGFADPDYLKVAAAAGASVVATHIRLAPRVPDPEPRYDDVVAAVAGRLQELGRRAEEAGIGAEAVMVDAGLDLGKTWQQSVVLLRASSTLAGLGYPVLLSASNKTFLGRLLGLDIDQRGVASLAACAIGITRGCRILRVHDVRGTRRVRDALAAVAAHAPGGGAVSEPVAAFLVKGSDPALVSQAVSAVLDEVSSGDTTGLATEDLTSEEPDVGAVIDACMTLPFLADRRVVVVRDLSRYRSDDVDRLVSYLDDPTPSTTLVLATAGAVSQRLVNAVRKAGRVVDASVPAGKGRGQWLADRLKDAPVRLDPGAARRLGEHLGDELGRLEGILGALAAAYGPGARIGVEDLEPFLGEAGGGAPWELTDAIDSGDVAAALAALHRLTGPGGRHPLVVLATLHRHYGSMLRLDGSPVRSDGEAAEILGLKSTFPAKKNRTQAGRLGSAGVGRAITLLAGADLDLRGATGAPEEAVLDVLVARLARLAPAARSAAARSAATRRR